MFFFLSLYSPCLNIKSIDDSGDLSAVCEWLCSDTREMSLMRLHIIFYDIIWLLYNLLCIVCVHVINRVRYMANQKHAFNWNFYLVNRLHLFILACDTRELYAVHFSAFNHKNLIQRITKTHAIIIFLLFFSAERTIWQIIIFYY